MHRQVRKFIRGLMLDFPHKFRFRKVLEVGAHCINGSARRYFWFCRYTGVDISKGKGVDIVGKFSGIDFGAKKFDVVLSTGTLEHDNEWDITLQKMYDLLKPGGLMIMTCAGPHHQEHGTSRTEGWHSPDTNDYYENRSIEDFESILPLPKNFVTYGIMYARGMNDLQFYGIKHYNV